MNTQGQHVVSESAVAQRGVFTASVADNRIVCSDHWVLQVDIANLPASRPGQFVHIGPIVGRAGQPFQPARPMLKRPFSIYTREQLSDGLSRVGILYRVLGVGTSYLASLRPGDQVQVIAPLGRPFHVPDDLRLAVMVAGGTGVAPVAYLAQALRARPAVKVVLFVGARSQRWLPFATDLAQPCPSPTVLSSHLPGVPVIVATDDGTAGHMGTVVDAADRWLAASAVDPRTTCVFSCGPEAMMAATAAVCERRGLPCQVSLEKHMSCGMGTCQSCVVRVKEPADRDGWVYKLCCKDGPAFDAKAVVWG